MKDRDYEFLENNAAIVTFLAGDTIIDRFEKGKDFYILVDGTVTRWMKDAMNREHFMEEFSRGDYMGESTLLERQKHHSHQRSATIRAETPCTLIRVSPESMSTILWRNPRILKEIREVNEERVSTYPRSTDKLRVYKPKKPQKQKKN
jgi:CRP-like cAMP-binding protein